MKDTHSYDISPYIGTTVSGAEAVVLSLMAHDTEVLFGYPGGAIMPVYDSLYNHREHIKHILTRHEQGAVHAAQGQARVTGRAGVCMATSGPGATNLITGIADAQIDSTPLVCITGQVFSTLLGTDAFQETDVIGISMPVTKWNIQVTRAQDIVPAIAKAFYIAQSGRPGPVLVDITKDAQVGECIYEHEPCTGVRSYKTQTSPSPDSLEQAADLINSAKKPLILFGQGIIISEAEKELEQLLDKTGIPAAWTILGLSALPTDHPLNVGMLGMHGNYAPNVLTNECDVLIAVGMRFDDRVTGDLGTYAKQAKIIHIEIDPSEINKNVKVDVPILGDAKSVLSNILPLVGENNHDAWLGEFKKRDAKEQEQVIDPQLKPTGSEMTMTEVVSLLSEKTEHDAVLVTDVGQHQMAGVRYWGFNQTRSNVTSGGLGTMGFALPAALGAQIGAPDRTVIALAGDGGIQMTIQELGTIFQTQAPVKIVILNNDYLGMVRQWQELFFDKRYASTEMVNPDFVMIAQGYHIHAARVESRDDLSGAIEEMLCHDGPYLLEVKVEKEGNIFPMVPAGASVSDIRLQ